MPTSIRETPSVRTIATRLAAAVAAIATVAACSDDVDILKPGLPSASFMERYVALGNSLTAGLQSGGINDSTQKESYAYLLAQAAGTQFRYVAIPNGCLPPARSFTGPLVNPQGGCAAPAPQPFVNNVGTPNASVSDLTSAYGVYAITFLNSFITGGKSQIRRAADANPTFATIWIPNNETLAPATVGVLTPVAGGSAGFIPTATLIAGSRAAVDSLRLLSPELRGGVLIGLVDITSAPRLFKGGALFTAAGTPSALKLSIDAITGRTVTVLPNCVGSTNLVSSEIIPRIKAGTYPAIIACEPTTITGVPAEAALGNLWILNATEQATLSAQVKAVNDYLAAKADSIGWGYFDPNNASTGLPAMVPAGLIREIPDFTDAVAPFGPGISTDGVHPRRPIHVAIANALIDVINGKYGSSIPKLSTTTT